MQRDIPLRNINTTPARATIATVHARAFPLRTSRRQRCRPYAVRKMASYIHLPSTSHLYVFLWQSALHVSAAADVTICVTSVFLCSAFIKHRKRKRWLSASSRVRMLQTRVIHFARTEALDSFGHGDRERSLDAITTMFRSHRHKRGSRLWRGGEEAMMRGDDEARTRFVDCV